MSQVPTCAEMRELLVARIHQHEEGSTNSVELSRLEALVIVELLGWADIRLNPVCGFSINRTMDDLKILRKANDWLSGLIEEALKVLGESPDATGALAAVQILNRTTSLSDEAPGVQI